MDILDRKMQKTVLIGDHAEPVQKTYILSKEGSSALRLPDQPQENSIQGSEINQDSLGIIHIFFF